MEHLILLQPINVAEQIVGAAGQNGLTLVEQIILLIIAVTVTQFVNHWINKRKASANRVKDSETIKSQLVTTFANDQEKFRKEVLALYEKEREKNQKLIDELEAYKAEFGDLTRQYQELSDKYNQLHKELESIRKELSETKKERDSLQNRVKVLEDEKGQLEGEVKKLQSIINNMRKSKK